MPARTLGRLAAAILAAIFLTACASPPEPPPQPAPVTACHTPPEVVGQVTLSNPGARVVEHLTGKGAAMLLAMLGAQGLGKIPGDEVLLFTNPEETILFVVTFVNGCAEKQITLKAGAA